MKQIEIPHNAARKELFAFLKQNKDALILQKKAMPKEGVGFCYDAKLTTPTAKTAARKDFASILAPEQGVLAVTAVINTSNWLDTARDCHMPGLWAKSLNDNKMMMHCQEHSMTFDKIIADGKDLKAYTKNFTWKELGFDYAGKTEALTFDSMVRKARNPFMYDQYEKGYVKNHSVYMSYVKMVLCINEPDDIDYGAEFEAYEKYIQEVVNKEAAEELGYFWAILEAKAIEGSAVPMGANVVTPTISVVPKAEPPQSTPKFRLPDIELPERGYKVGNVQFKKMLQ